MNQFTEQCKQSLRAAGITDEQITIMEREYLLQQLRAASQTPPQPPPAPAPAVIQPVQQVKTNNSRMINGLIAAVVTLIALYFIFGRSTGNEKATNGLGEVPKSTYTATVKVEDVTLNGDATITGKWEMGKLIPDNGQTQSGTNVQPNQPNNQQPDGWKSF